MANPLGTENLKKLIKFGLDITKQIAEALKDGKVSTAEIFSFLPQLMQVPGVVKSWPDIVAEFKDLSTEDRADLHTYFAGEFDIPNDKVEVFIENALLQAISLIKLVEEFKALKPPPAPPTP